MLVGGFSLNSNYSSDRNGSLLNEFIEFIFYLLAFYLNYLLYGRICSVLHLNVINYPYIYSREERKVVS